MKLITCLLSFIGLLIEAFFSKPNHFIGNKRKLIKIKRTYKSLMSFESKNKSKNKEKTALLIIDMQKQYTDSKFPGYVPNTEKIFENINNIRKYFLNSLGNENYIEIFTVDCLMKYSNCLLGRDEIKIDSRLIDDSTFKNIRRIPIHPNLDKNEAALNVLIPNVKERNLFVIEKAGERAEYSAFGETWEGQNKYGRGKENSIANRILEIHEIKNVYVVGLAFQQCVLYSAADAAYLKYKTFIVKNATNSSVFTFDKKMNKIADKNLIKEQEFENNKVDIIVKNKFNGLPKGKDEILELVEFQGNRFGKDH